MEASPRRRRTASYTPGRAPESGGRNGEDCPSRDPNAVFCWRMELGSPAQRDHARRATPLAGQMQGLMSSVLQSFLLGGGPILWVLIGLGVWLWTILILRTMLLRVEPENREDAAQKLIVRRAPSRGAIEAGAVEEAHPLLLRASPAEHPEVNMAWSRLQAELRRFRRTIRTLTAAAPMLGLLGTVSGMIQTFETLGSNTESEGVAAGIAEALITTEMGLALAIPGLFWGYWLERKELRVRRKLGLLMAPSSVQERSVRTDLPSQS